MHSLIYLIGKIRWIFKGYSETTADGDSVSCYACGQADINPETDVPNSYCDVFLENNNCPKTSKVYNLTCDIMDKKGKSDYWVRKCPAGVKSCFVATGSYDGQSKIILNVIKKDTK